MAISGFLLTAYKDMIDAPHRFSHLAVLSFSRTQMLDLYFNAHNFSHALRREDSDPNGTSLLNYP